MTKLRKTARKLSFHLKLGRTVVTARTEVRKMALNDDCGGWLWL